MDTTTLRNELEHVASTVADIQVGAPGDKLIVRQSILLAGNLALAAIEALHDIAQAVRPAPAPKTWRTDSD